MPYAYDDQNIFAKILRQEIPVSPIFESDHTLAFPDISPQKATHVLVIPKGPYISFDHFAAEATDAEIIGYVRAISEVCKAEGVTLDAGEGFRMIANAGAHGVQEVPHLHVHILGGRPMGRMVARPS